MAEPQDKLEKGQAKFYLSREAHEALRRQAAEEGISMSKLVEELALGLVGEQD